jgi:hypothetical protein
MNPGADKSWGLSLTNVTVSPIGKGVEDNVTVQVAFTPDPSTVEWQVRLLTV